MKDNAKLLSRMESASTAKQLKARPGEERLLQLICAVSNELSNVWNIIGLEWSRITFFMFETGFTSFQEYFTYDELIIKQLWAKSGAP